MSNDMEGRMQSQIEGAQVAYEAAMAAGDRPAYPVPGLEAAEEFNGITIRDHFASQALVGLLAEDTTEGSLVNNLGLKMTGSSADFFADAAYTLADAMLRRRAR